MRLKLEAVSFPRSSSSQFVTEDEILAVLLSAATNLSGLGQERVLSYGTAWGADRSARGWDLVGSS